MLRWKCTKCNLTWIYPVEKCIHCKGAIVKERSKKFKVIGFTKVTIPSPMHPIVPYNVLLLEDEHGNKYPRKTMKDYEINEEFYEENAKTENAVSIVKIKYDLYDAIEHSLDLINFKISSKSKILIKPSIIYPAYPYQAINNNPKTINAIIKYLIDRKIKPENITVGEQSPFGIDTRAAALKSGILEICTKNKINMVDFSKTEFQEKSVGNYMFKISKEVLNKDLIINVPSLKTHSQFSIAGALENMIRITDIETQKEIHKKKFSEALALLNKAVKYITIGDASIGLHGNGPLIMGEPAFLNLILASRDPVALDRIFCEIGMLKVPQYLKDANAIELGNCELNKIEVVGNEVDAVKFSLNSANENPSPHSSIKVVDGISWSGDFIAMFNLLSKISNIKTPHFTMAVGSLFVKAQFTEEEKIVAFGDNAIQRLQTIGIKPIAEIKGNPPDINDTLKNIQSMKQLAM